MIELKFRAWSGSQMFTFEPSNKHRYYIAIGGESWGVYDKNDARVFIKEDEGTDLMQYIGQRDKNDKEIFEGDILKVHIFTQELGENMGVREGEKEFIARVVWQTGGWWLEGEETAYNGFVLWLNGLHEESFEVIGNVYETPELTPIEIPIKCEVCSKEIDEWTGDLPICEECSKEFGSEYKQQLRTGR